jgi:hypothetical protein
LLISDKALDKPSSGAKTLGLGTLKESSENAFKNLVSKNGFEQMKDKGVGGFQMTLVITKCSLRTINPCNHITPVWDGA